jgi:hypothetical protein
MGRRDGIMGQVASHTLGFIWTRVSIVTLSVWVRYSSGRNGAPWRGAEPSDRLGRRLQGRQAWSVITLIPFCWAAAFGCQELRLSW